MGIEVRKTKIVYESDLVVVKEYPKIYEIRTKDGKVFYIGKGTEVDIRGNSWQHDILKLVPEEVLEGLDCKIILWTE